ncbi:MAG: CopG family transcriptional regulator [Cyanobacteriota bacterium]|nr:CopG family transcriptional regulator [Cyanobacteriota bacterium]
MRTTLRLDDDVLASARVLARQRGESLGAVISELARRGLHQPPPQCASPDTHRNELRLLPLRAEGAPVDLELVNSLRDELP